MPDIKQDDFQEPIYEPKDSEAYKIIGIVFIILFIMVSAILLAIVVFNSNNDRIISGIYIKNINVSGLTKQEAITKVNKNLEEYMDDSLVLVHNEYRTEISLEQLEATFDVEAAVNAAYSVGKTGNIFKDGTQILNTMFSNINIDPILNINEDVKIMETQHHHSHVVSCMVENDINEQVIGIAYDGTGYGDDRHAAHPDRRPNQGHQTDKGQDKRHRQNEGGGTEKGGTFRLRYGHTPARPRYLQQGRGGPTVRLAKPQRADVPVDLPCHQHGQYPAAA